ncbi:MAG: aquaporin family protein [Solirubrobacterales bacterium]|nr:aquaporin family protein [Solirubrobacterales bacterium]
MESHQPRRLLAEAVGTALLVFFGPGAAVAALTVGGGELDYAGLGMIALSFGLIVAVVIYAFGTTSGAHINPAVSITLAAVGRFPWREVPLYVVAQVIGAIVGAALLALAFGDAAIDLGLGQTAVSEGVSIPQAIVAEAVATFVLVTAIMGLAVDRRAPAGWAGLMIGLAVTVAILVVAPLTGASLNPARTLGPLVVATVGGGETAWSDLPVYLVGPVLGGLAAAFAYDAIAQPRDADDTDAAQGTQGDIEGRRDGGDPAGTSSRSATVEPDPQDREGT